MRIMFEWVIGFFLLLTIAGPAAVGATAFFLWVSVRIGWHAAQDGIERLTAWAEGRYGK